MGDGMLRRVRCSVAAAAFISLLFTGAATTLREAPASAQSLTVIRVASTADDDDTAILYGIQSGAFQRAGLDVQFQTLSSGSAIAAAVVGGSVDIGKSGTVTLVNAYAHGVPITVVAPAAVYDTTESSITEIVVAADTSIHTAKELNGANIAVATLRGLQQICISGWVDKHGGDSKSLHFLDVPLGAMRAAIDNHRVTAGMMSYPELADALASGEVRVLGHASEGIANHFLGTAWFSSRDWTRAHPAAVAVFAQVLRSSATYVNAHHAETIPMMAAFTGISAARFEGMPRELAGTTLDAADLQPVIDAAARYDTIDKTFPASALIFSASGTR